MSIYAIRRAIVEAMHAYHTPQMMGTILIRSELLLAFGHRLTDDDIVMIRREWNHLRGTGHLVDIPGYDCYCKLNATIRQKLDNRSALSSLNPLSNDETLYGADAVE